MCKIQLSWRGIFVTSGIVYEKFGYAHRFMWMLGDVDFKRENPPRVVTLKSSMRDLTFPKCIGTGFITVKVGKWDLKQWWPLRFQSLQEKMLNLNDSFWIDVLKQNEGRVVSTSNNGWKDFYAINMWKSDFSEKEFNDFVKKNGLGHAWIEKGLSILTRS